MTVISKYVHIDKLTDAVDEYNNTYYKTIKMKPVNVMSSTYIDLSVENDNKDPKSKVCNLRNICN